MLTAIIILTVIGLVVGVKPAIDLLDLTHCRKPSAKLRREVMQHLLSADGPRGSYRRAGRNQLTMPNGSMLKLRIPAYPSPNLGEVLFEMTYPDSATEEFANGKTFGTQRLDRQFADLMRECDKVPNDPTNRIWRSREDLRLNTYLT